MELHVNGVKLYYRVSGHGPAVILVHGNGEDHSVFDETAAPLSCDYTVYALDSRGHGKSTAVETLGYQNMADDVASFIKNWISENRRSAASAMVQSSVCWWRSRIPACCQS